MKASEAGNIFPLGTKFSKALGFEYTDQDNERHLTWMGSYGIGTTRLVGIIAEKFSDDKGLVWPDAVAPYRYHVIALGSDAAHEAAEKLVAELGEDNVLFDERADASAGQKFADAELIGCPIRIVVSDKTLERDAIEVTSRAGKFEQQDVSRNDATASLQQLSA